MIKDLKTSSEFRPHSLGHGEGAEVSERRTVLREALQPLQRRGGGPDRADARGRGLRAESELRGAWVRQRARGREESPAPCTEKLLRPTWGVEKVELPWWEPSPLSG